MDLSCIAHARWLTLWIVWFSFNSISREFFFATTSGLFLWLGVLSFQYLLCFFPNINVFIRSISRLLVFLWGIHAFQSFRIYMKRATFQTNIELNCLLRCQPSGFSFWPCTSLFFLLLCQDSLSGEIPLPMATTHPWLLWRSWLSGSDKASATSFILHLKQLTVPGMEALLQ